MFYFYPLNKLFIIEDSLCCILTSTKLFHNVEPDVVWCQYNDRALRSAGHLKNVQPGTEAD